MLQQQQNDGKQHQSSSSSPNSTIIQDQDSNTKVPSKQRFQAITKAYEIVTNPYYKAYYETYGLPPLKPDAPTVADSTIGTPHRTHTNRTGPSSRHIDPVEDDRNDYNNTNHSASRKEFLRTITDVL